MMNHYQGKLVMYDDFEIAFGDFKDLIRWTPPPSAAQRISQATIPQTRDVQDAHPHFLEGDNYRDRADWNNAAYAYSLGLEIDPHAFGYRVQLANCLKEAGRFVESERAYLDALDSQPNDRDANLQLGRLYRLINNDEAAEFHFLKAAEFHFLKAAHLAPSAASAMQELAAMEFDIASLPERWSS